MEASEPQITAVAFQRCASKAHCSGLTRWSEPPHNSPPTDVQVVATVTAADKSSHEDKFFLLTTTEYVIAPLDAYSITDFDKLKTGNEVSWGQLAKDDDMQALVVRGMSRGEKRAVTLRTLNLQRILRDSFSAPDVLWPWLVRVTATLIDRHGKTVSVQSGVLEVVASDKRMRASSNQAPP